MVSLSFSMHVHSDRAAMGHAAGRSAADVLRTAIAARGSARMIAAAAPSQLEVYRALAAEPDIDWSAVTILHMDEYMELPESAPQRFGNWLRTHFVQQIAPARFLPMRPERGESSAAEYDVLLSEAAIDLVCLGIGVNGHIAFNDPPDARFDDPLRVRVVRLDEASRVQQVDDGCFESVEQVPTHALTLTIPALLAGARLVCSVPGRRKAEAVRALIEEPVDPTWPCTVLRRHASCEVHTDQAAASLLFATP